LSIRVLLANEQEVAQLRLPTLMKSRSDVTVVGIARDGHEAIEQATRFRPDVVVMGVSRETDSELNAIAALSRAHGGIKVLALSRHADRSAMRTALSAGASGYVEKCVSDMELLTAIQAVAQGRMFIDLAPTSGGSETTAGSAGKWKDCSIQGAVSMQRLSPREREVLYRVAHGYTNGRIAAHLRVSIKSVETYRARLTEKLGVRTRAELVRFAVGSGLLTPGRVVEAE
jgi:two-component system, NarL family, response regulator NreC